MKITHVLKLAEKNYSSVNRLIFYRLTVTELHNLIIIFSPTIK